MTNLLSTLLARLLTSRIHAYAFALILFSGLTHAENGRDTEETTSKKASIKIHYDKQSIKNSTTKSAMGRSPSKMSNGLIEIKNIRLQGDTLFPEYGITTKFLHYRVKHV